MEWAGSGKRMKVSCFTFSLHYLHIQSYRNIKSLRGKERAVTLSLEVQSEGQEVIIQEKTAHGASTSGSFSPPVTEGP